MRETAHPGKAWVTLVIAPLKGAIGFGLVFSDFA